MKASMTTLVAVLTISSLGILATNASACGRYKSNYNSYRTKVYVKKVYVEPTYVEPLYDQCYHPCYSTCFAYPGDTWFTLSKRIYGTPNMWKYIASYNGLGASARLPFGQQLRLPVINANGTLAASSAAPGPMNFGAPGRPAGLPGQGFAPQGQPGFPGQTAAPQGLPFGGQSPQAAGQFGQQFGQTGQPGMPQMNAPQMNAPQMNAPQTSAAQNTLPAQQPAAASQPAAPATPAVPAANIRVESAEESLPSVAIGSTLTLSGREIGEERGTARLRISGLALPIGILEWNNTSARVQLPELDVTSSMKAEIEVLRADGSLASKTAVKLTPATTRLALGN